MKLKKLTPLAVVIFLAMPLSAIADGYNGGGVQFPTHADPFKYGGPGPVVIPHCRCNDGESCCDSSQPSPSDSNVSTQPTTAGCQPPANCIVTNQSNQSTHVNVGS